MLVNCDIPLIECYARAEFFRQMDHNLIGQYERVLVHQAVSIEGRCLSFNILTTYGRQWSRLPLHALCWKENAPNRPIGELQMWDCFSYYCCVNVPSFLDECKVLVRLGDKEPEQGTYLFTIDYYKSSMAESAGENGYKSHSVMKLDDGNFCAIPYNRVLRWNAPSWVTEEKMPEGMPEWKYCDDTWSAEQDMEYMAENSDEWAYQLKKV